MKIDENREDPERTRWSNIHAPGKIPCLPSNKKIIYPIGSPALRWLLSTQGISCTGFILSVMIL